MSTETKITMLVGYFTPEMSADTHLNANLAEGFSQLGASVTVITPFPSRGVDAQSQQHYESLRDERINGRLRIIRVGNQGRYQDSLIRRALVFLKKTWSLYRIAKSIETDVYFVVSTPPFLGYAAALLSRKKPVVYKLQDIFPDSLVHSGKLSQRNPALFFLHCLERWVYCNVAQIHVCSGDIAHVLKARGVHSEKIRVIYDWVDEQSCVPVAREKNDLFEQLGLSRKGFYVSYAGNIGHLQNVETILRAAARLKTKWPEILFVIIGDGACRPRIEQMIKMENLTNVRWFPMQPQNKVSEVYSLGDIEIVSLKSDVTKMALPSKTWSIMSAARPVIGEIDLSSELCTIIMKCGCGVCVSPDDDAAMAEQIIKLYFKSEAEREAMGQCGREYITHNLLRSQAIGCHFAETQGLCVRRTANVSQ